MVWTGNGAVWLTPQTRAEGHVGFEALHGGSQDSGNPQVGSGFSDRESHSTLAQEHMYRVIAHGARGSVYHPSK